MVISVEKIDHLSGADLSDICQATEDAIIDGIGFNWVSPPMREQMEGYWRGVVMVPDRILLIGRLDGAAAGAIQLIKPSKTRETSAFTVKIESHFVAPWARGHGLAKLLIEEAEREAMKQGYSMVRLSVRETQERALQIYREGGYVEWGQLPYYEMVNGSMVTGHFFYKKLGTATALI